MHWNQEETSSLPAPCLPSGLITLLRGTLFTHSLITHPEHETRARRLRQLQRQLSTFAG